MTWHATTGIWRAAYRRQVVSAFRTVPLYRERWALDGRTDPALVPGRPGTDGGAVPAAEAHRRMADLVPLAGGNRTPDPLRGLRPVLAGSRPARRSALVVVLAEDLGQETTIDGVFEELVGTVRRGGTVTAVGSAARLAKLSGRLPAGLTGTVDLVPCRTLAELHSGHDGPALLHDRMLGFLGGLWRCGRWHVDWPRVYVRATTVGLAFTLLRQRSPRLVDILIDGGVAGRVTPCPRHGTPVVSP